MADIETWKKLTDELALQEVVLIAVSKTKPAADIIELYNAGQRDFGENYVQELTEKQAVLPADIRWHFIGHLQSNKVKYIAPFVHLVHGVDNARLLAEISKQAQKNDRTIDVLLQMHIAQEETKFGLDEQEAMSILQQLPSLPNVRICGLMGMATNTDDDALVQKEFASLKAFFDRLKTGYFAGAPWFNILSMGMSADYRMAIAAGSNMVRIGSMLFGSRI